MKRLSLLIGALVFFALSAVNLSAQSNPKVIWKFSHTQAPDHFQNKASLMMAKYVSEKTNGNFVIQIFPSGTLGWEREVLESMQMGTLNMTWSAVGPFAQFVPGYNVFSIPGVFRSEEQIKKAVTDPNVIGKLRKSAEEKNLMEVGLVQYFFRNVFVKSKSINTPDDFIGQKIRVMGVPVLVDTFKALGANVTTTAWAELYSAMQLGVVDGLDHVATSVKTMKFYELLKYGVELPLFPTPMLMVVSKPAYEKLPANYKQILQEGIKIAIDECNRVSYENNMNDKEFLKKQGMKFTTPDLTPFLKKVEPVKQKYIKELDPWLRELVSEIEKM